MSRLRLLICIAAASLLAVGVAACGGETKTVTEQSAAGTPASGGDSGKTVNIIASVPPTDHGWLGAVSKNAKAEAEKYKDVKFELLQAADADSQAQQVEQAIAKKPDVLRGAAPGRRRADPGGPEGRAGRHPGGEHRPHVHASPTPRRRRCWATTTRSARWRRTTSPKS